MRMLLYFLAAGSPALLAELFKLKESGGEIVLIDALILCVTVVASGSVAVRALVDRKETDKQDRRAAVLKNP